MSNFKRTPEQEAYRISRVQAALKGHPPTEVQRKARADGLRKAWAEGRIKPSSTPESAAKTAAKLRGRKRPQELIDRIRLKNIGKKRTPEVVAAMSQRVIAGYAAGKYRVSTEKLKERNRKISEANKGRKQSWAQRRRHSEAMTGRHWNPDVVESRAAPMRNRPQTAEATKSGPTNVNSLEGALRDAFGRIWRFRNLSHFVRTHAELFEADDLIEKQLRPTKPYKSCNAIKRLLALFGRGKCTPGTWKGWTVVSETELGEDLIARNLQEAK